MVIETPVFSYWHEIVFGGLLTNVALGFAVLRFVTKVSKKYKIKVDYFFEKIDILWKDYGVRKYGQNDGINIFEKLDKELENHVRYD